MGVALQTFPLAICMYINMYSASVFVYIGDFTTFAEADDTHTTKRVTLPLLTKSEEELTSIVSQKVSLHAHTIYICISILIFAGSQATLA